MKDFQKAILGSLFCALASVASAEDHSPSEGSGRPEDSGTELTAPTAHLGHPCHTGSPNTDAAFVAAQRRYCAANEEDFTGRTGINGLRFYSVKNSRNGIFSGYEDALTACLEHGFTLPVPGHGPEIREALGCFVRPSVQNRFCTTPAETGAQNYWALSGSASLPGIRQSFRPAEASARPGAGGRAGILCASYEKDRVPEAAQQINRCYGDVLAGAGRAMTRRGWSLHNLSGRAIRTSIDDAVKEITWSGLFRLCGLGSAEVSAIRRVIEIRFWEANARLAEERRKQEDAERRHGTISVDPQSQEAAFQDFMGRIQTVREQWARGDRVHAVLHAIFFPGNLLDQGTVLASPFVGGSAPRYDRQTNPLPSLRNPHGIPPAVLRDGREVPRTRVPVTAAVVAPVAAVATAPVVPPVVVVPPPVLPIPPTPPLSASARREILINTARSRPAPPRGGFGSSWNMTESFSVVDRGRGGAPREISVTGIITTSGRVLTISSLGIRPADSPNYSREGAAVAGPGEVLEMVRRLSARARAAGYEVLILDGHRVTGARHGPLAVPGAGNIPFHEVIDLQRPSVAP